MRAGGHIAGAGVAEAAESAAGWRAGSGRAGAGSTGAVVVVVAAAAGVQAARRTAAAGRLVAGHVSWAELRRSYLSLLYLAEELQHVSRESLPQNSTWLTRKVLRLLAGWWWVCRHGMHGM